MGSKSNLVFLLILALIGVSCFYFVGFESLSSEGNGKYDYDYDYTWTKAICSGNSCRDYEVTCLNGDVVRMKAVSGLVVFGDDWVDERENRGVLCE